MPPIQNVLIATDFSERAAFAEERAAMLCKQHQCSKAELMTVKEAGEPETLALVNNMSVASAEDLITHAARQELHERSATLSDNFGVDFDLSVRFGKPAWEIAGRGEELAADLIVLGAHGGNFFTDLFLGNTADRLIRLCKRPMLTVKNEPSLPYSRILVPVDFSEESDQAARVALCIAPEASITFLHAYDVQIRYASVTQEVIHHYRREARENARLSLNRFIEDLDAADRLVSRVIIFGVPSAVVRDYAEKMQPDLIVMGKHGRSRVEEMIIGSVTRDTIDQTHCDILVVPPFPVLAQSGNVR
ncbi:universal stress protein [Noviherbaspirillum sp.]|uniref:universal stress protein n=1 Tax=Noviherbaspirillum sp. TaxID=1926288 RepID=UPI002FE26B3B